MKNSAPRFRLPLLVRMARAIRHIHALKKFDKLWTMLRPRYHWLLNVISGGKGLPVRIEGIGAVYVPPSFLGGGVDAWEITMLQRMAACILADTCFYDIGASTGLHSIVAGDKLEGAGEVHAFEPDLASCARYWRNTGLLRKRGVGVYLSRAFVCNSHSLCDPARLFPAEAVKNSRLLDRKSAQHLYLFEHPRTGPPDPLIPHISLDGYIQAGRRPPSVIKCDIEGAELLFLRGATETLRAARPLLFVSLHPELVGHFDYGESDFFGFLQALNYKWEILNDVGETHVFAESRYLDKPSLDAR